MAKQKFDTELMLREWVAHYQVTPEQSNTVRNAIVAPHRDHEVLTYQWWREFTGTVVRQAMLPTRLHYASRRR